MERLKVVVQVEWRPHEWRNDIMPSPFPGMDPYLETPNLWPDVHHELISQIRSALNPALLPRYVSWADLLVCISDVYDPGRGALIPDVRVEKTTARNGKKRKGEVVA